MENLDVKLNEEVCYNCKHIAWAIGVGQGLKCSNPKESNFGMSIPSVKHTCELFEIKEGLKPLGEELTL